MKIQIEIKDAVSDEVRICSLDHDQDAGDDHVMFMWGDGNFGCDCNRGIFFAEAGGETENDEGVDCGETRFVVLSIREEGGRMITDHDPRQND